MATLEDTVKQVVNDFVTSGTLFTALDVSNAVKTTFPFYRHREIRDCVRGMYADMQALSYGRTPINVTLEDGTVAEALLYHPLSDSWDLDTKYDTQKRTAGSNLSPTTATPVVVAPVATQTVPAPLPMASTPPVTTVTVSATTTASPKQVWDHLFDDAKLFP